MTNQRNDRPSSPHSQLVRHLGWQPEVEVQAERDGDLLGEEAPEGAPCGIGAPDQLGG
jgi:hypothetical protein